MRRLFGGRSKPPQRDEYSIINPIPPSEPDYVSPTRPSLTLNLSSFGMYIVPSPSLLATGANNEGIDQPREDHILHGDLEVLIPEGLGQRRCKSIRVGLIGTALLDFGFGTGGPRKYNLSETWTSMDSEGQGEDGIVLYPGLQKFAFSIIIPSNVPIPDWHDNAALGYDLIADLQGYGGEPLALPEMEPPLPMPVRRKHQQPATDLPVNPWSYEGYIKIVHELTGVRLRLKHPSRFPPYPNGGPGEGIGEKLMGRYAVTRVVYLVYNPDPDRGLPTLNERWPGFMDGVGLWEITLRSEAWTIAAYVQSRLTITAPSPKLTLWSFRLSLIQTHTITSPNGEEGLLPQSRSETFRIVSTGKHPAANTAPKDMPTPIWQGKGAGGKDDMDFELHGAGRLPDDRKVRPSKVPGVSGPIEVKHEWMISFTFSIYGEDENGQPLKGMGNGSGVGTPRTLTMSRPVTVPSCIITADNLNLPSYLDVRQSTTRGPDPCPVCQTPISQQLCTSCPTHVFPHPRHDHPPKLVGTESGVCPLCSQNLVPRGTPNQGNCACGIPLDRLEVAAKAARKREEEEGSERLVASLMKDDQRKS